jgi:DNA processing protein
VRSELEAAAVVALLRASKRPWREYSELIEEAGGAMAVLEREQALLATELVEAAAAEIAAWERAGIRVIPLLDPAYPSNLRAVHDRPPLIFAKGSLEPHDIRSVAVIGTRRPSDRGVDCTRMVVSKLVERGYTIVSGLALGIDTVAHSTALDSGGRTLAVIGTGLRRSYPPQNAELQSRIAADGAVLSQFWPEDPPTRTSFPQRNATMSGLALANVIIEAGPTSGARTQARLALAHGRPVLLFEPFVNQQWARELASKPGAHVVRSPAEAAETVERLTSLGALVA